MNAPSPWFALALGVLATWRVSHLIAYEDGPFDAVARLRERAGHGMLGRLMDCPYCVSLWIAAPAALFVSRPSGRWLLAWLAISGGASLIEKLAAAAARSNLPLDGAHHHVLLRTETRRDDGAERAPAPRHGSSPAAGS